MQVDLKYAWVDKRSGITEDAEKLLSQAHSLWINMWLIDHSVDIPKEDLT